MHHGGVAHGFRARRARRGFDPAVLDGFHSKALVIWIGSGEVAIRIEAADGVTAAELKILKVAHFPSSAKCIMLCDSSRCGVVLCDRTLR